MQISRLIISSLMSTSLCLAAAEPVFAVQFYGGDAAALKNESLVTDVRAGGCAPRCHGGHARPSGHARPGGHTGARPGGHTGTRPVNSGHRPGAPAGRPPGARPGAPGVRPGAPGVRPGVPGVRPGVPGGYHGGIYRGGPYGGVWRGGPWVRSYGWPVGGAIAAGAAIGFVGAAAAASYAPAPPQDGMCWYYTDSTQRNGFWDTCP